MELHLVSLSPCPDNTLCQKQTTAAVGLWLPWLTYCYVYWPLCVDVGGERLVVWGSSCTNPFSAVTWSIVRSRTGGIDYSGTVLRQKDAHPLSLVFIFSRSWTCLSFKNNDNMFQGVMKTTDVCEGRAPGSDTFSQSQDRRACPAKDETSCNNFYWCQSYRWSSN